MTRGRTASQRNCASSTSFRSHRPRNGNKRRIIKREESCCPYRAYTLLVFSLSSLLLIVVVPHNRSCASFKPLVLNLPIVLSYGPRLYVLYLRCFASSRRLKWKLKFILWEIFVEVLYNTMYEIIKKKLCIVIQDKIYLNDVLNLDPFAKMEKYYVTVKFHKS